MGQVVLFLLFIITLIAGIYLYFVPTQNAVNAINPSKLEMKDNNGFFPDETLTSTRELKVDMKTSGGVLQIFKEVDNLSQEQKKLTGIIGVEQQALKNTKEEIADLSNHAVKSDQDLLRIKALGLQMQDEEKLLVANGQQLVAINDQLTKDRQWLTDQNNLVNFSNQSSFESWQQHNVMINDKAASLMEKAKQQNIDSMQHSQDEQQRIQQHIEEEEQRMQDQQNR